MRPAPGVDMQGYAGRVGGQGRTLRPIDTRAGGQGVPSSRESRESNRSPLTPRARSHAALYPQQQQQQQHPHPPSSSSTPPTLPPVLNSALADPETAHLFPSALRPSTSGPDLASLRRRAADERRHMASPVARSDGVEILGPSPRHRADRQVSPPPSSPPHAHSTSPGKGISMSGSARIDPPGRKAVGLQDFVFGEVIGKGSYSTVRFLFSFLSWRVFCLGVSSRRPCFAAGRSWFRVSARISGFLPRARTLWAMRRQCIPGRSSTTRSDGSPTEFLRADRHVAHVTVPRHFPGTQRT